MEPTVSDYIDINRENFNGADVAGYTRDRQLSNKYIGVYHKGNHSVIAHLGTNDIPQLSADVNYLTGTRSDYIRDRISEHRDILGKISGRTIYTTGFSLGGLVANKSLSDETINKRTKEVHTFNGLNSIRDTNYHNTHKITNHVNAGDFVSSGYRPGKTKHYFSQFLLDPYKAHSISNFPKERKTSSQKVRDIYHGGKRR
jgi:hypothetical protein